jgi:hypothetical protein
MDLHGLPTDEPQVSLGLPQPLAAARLLVTRGRGKDEGLAEFSPKKAQAHFEHDVA